MMNSGPQDQEKIAALMEKHGMSLLGPPLSPDQDILQDEER